MDPWSDWNALERLVLARPPGRDLYVIRAAMPHPQAAGMRRAFGVPKGTFAHFRRALPWI